VGRWTDDKTQVRGREREGNMEVDIPVDAPQVRERPEKTNRNRKHAVPERVEEHQRTDWKDCNERTKDEVKHNTTIVGEKNEAYKTTLRSLSYEQFR
jgi:hypothetical protein